MGLNIKNPETCRLAAELAKLTGDTMTGAITKALRNEIEQEQRRLKAEERVKKVLKLIRDSGPSHGASSSDHNDLYDELGLSR